MSRLDLGRNNSGEAHQMTGVVHRCCGISGLWPGDRLLPLIRVIPPCDNFWKERRLMIKNCRDRGQQQHKDCIVNCVTV